MLKLEFNFYRKKGFWINLFNKKRLGEVTLSLSDSPMEMSLDHAKGLDILGITGTKEKCLTVGFKISPKKARRLKTIYEKSRERTASTRSAKPNLYSDDTGITLSRVEGPTQFLLLLVRNAEILKETNNVINTITSSKILADYLISRFKCKVNLESDCLGLEI